MIRSVSLWYALLTVLLLGLILAVAGLLHSTLSILLLIFAGVLLAIFLNALTGWLSRAVPLSYPWCYAIVVVLLLAAIGGGGYYLGSQIAERAATLGSELESATEQLSEQLRDRRWAQRHLPEMSKIRESLLQGGGFASGMLDGVRRLLWGVTGLLVIGFVGLYVAYDPDLYQRGLLKLVPKERRERAGTVLHTIHMALGRWIIGRLLSMTLIGVLTGLGLWLLDVPLPVTLGVIAALLTFIPNIGPLVAAVPQALLALQVGTNTAIYVIIFNVVLQTVESYVITPMVQRYEASLPPALTIFMQLLMGTIVGIIGVVMAAPLTAAAMVLVQTLYIQDHLDDSDPGRLANQGQQTG